MKKICENCGAGLVLVKCPTTKSFFLTFIETSLYSLIGGTLIIFGLQQKPEVFYYLLGIGLMFIFYDLYKSYHSFHDAKSLYCSNCETYIEAALKASTKATDE